MLIHTEDTIEEKEQKSSCNGAQMSKDIHHEDWGVVSVEGASSKMSDDETSTSGGSKETSGSGILILSGEERKDVDISTHWTKNLSLSFPGSDSFPSEVGSLRDYAEEPPELEKMALEHTAPRMEPGDFIARIKEFYRPRKAQVLLAVALASVLITVYLACRGNSWRSSALQLEKENLQLKRELEEARNAFMDLRSLAFQAEKENLQLKREFEEARIAFLDLRSSSVRVEEENLQLKREFEEARKAFLDLSSSALEVDEENLQLKRELEEGRKTLLEWQASLLYFAGQRDRLQSTALRLEEENLRLNYEVEEARNAFLDWDAETPTQLVDNCWLRAGASLQLGSCGEEARDYLLESLGSLYKS